MDSATRAELIRKGNAAFNAGDYPTARDCFTRSGYKDGLVRLGDYYMYDRRLPLLAYGYYKRAGAQQKIADLHRRMVGALGQWLGRDKIREESLRDLGLEQPHFSAGPAPEDVDAEGMVRVPVAPELRQAALEILKNR